MAAECPTSAGKRYRNASGGTPPRDRHSALKTPLCIRAMRPLLAPNGIGAFVVGNLNPDGDAVRCLMRRRSRKVLTGKAAAEWVDRRSVGKRTVSDLTPHCAVSIRRSDVTDAPDVAFAAPCAAKQLLYAGKIKQLTIWLLGYPGGRPAGIRSLHSVPAGVPRSEATFGRNCGRHPQTTSRARR